MPAWEKSHESGSSPLARGLPHRSFRAWTTPGIIPARAGFTEDDVGSAVQPEDHPRSRGVYPYVVDSELAHFGSSPLARGLPADDEHFGVSGRIIPARAGFTANTLITRSRTKDHPRSRGVYRRGGCPRGSWAGSSPLARGLPQDADGLLQAVRIIPARAGFTEGADAPEVPGQDHPRSRGVYPRMRTASSRRSGSSPLARGLLGRQNRLRPVDGIIPARAGFTSPSRSPPAPCRDHPRSRGVYPGASRSQIAYVGSSPLARGLRRSRCSAS